MTSESNGHRAWWHRVDFDHLALTAVIGFFIFFLLAPFISILIVSFTGRDVNLLGGFLGFSQMEELYHRITDSATIKYYTQLITFPRYTQALVNSVTMGLGVAAACVLLSLPIAYGLARAQIPGARLIGALCMVPLMIPTFISSFAFILMFGKTGWITQLVQKTLGLQEFLDIHSPLGVILVQIFFFFPYALLPLLAVFKVMDRTLEEAAHLLHARRLFAFFTTTLPMAAPGIGAGALLVFVVSLEDFGTPMILSPRRFPLLIVEAYREMVGYFNWGGAATIAVLLVLLSALVLIAQRRVLGSTEFRTITGKPASRDLIKDPRVCIPLFLYSLMILVIPLLAIYTTAMQSFAKTWGTGLLPDAFTLENYTYVIERSTGAVLNSFFLGGAALVISMALSAIIPYLVVRRQKVFLDYLGFLPLALPGVPLGIAMILAFNNPPLKLTGTAFLLIITYVIRRMPYALRSTMASIRAIGADIEEASFVMGAPKFLSLWGVTLPLMLPGIFAGAIMVFLTSIREISATILLAPQEWKPMSLVIFEGLIRGEFYTSSAISMILIVVVIVLQYVVLRLVGEKALF
jgi:iron(III) transport system permease protein